MIEESLRLLNGNETFINKLPAIIEVFVQFYGEESRSHIEESFNSIIPICFNKPKEKEYIIQRVQDKVRKLLYEPFILKYGLTKDNQSKYLPFALDKKCFTIPEKYEEYKERRDMSSEAKFEESKKEFMTILSGRYRYPHSFDHIKSKSSEELEVFMNKLPEYLRYQLQSLLTTPFVDWKEQSLKEQVIKLLQGEFPEITLENFDEMYANRNNNCLSNLDNQLADFQAIRREYQQTMDPFQPFIEYVEKCKILEQEISEKHFINLILEYKDYLPESEVQELCRQRDNNERLYLYKMPVIESYFNSSLSFTPDIASFSSENESILKTSEPDNWRLSSIRYDRIRFYKRQGIDHGDDFDAYEQDPRCAEVRPSTELADRIVADKKSREEQARIEYYESLPDFKMDNERIRQAGITNDEPGYDPNTYENTVMCICPNTKEVDGVVSLAPLGIFRLTESSLDTLDSFIMHELNHVYELDLIEDTPEYTKYSCGWEVIIVPKHQDKITTLEKDEEKRDYELFNEIINELISQDISELLHENDIYLFSSPENSKIKNKTSYEGTIFIIRDFYKMYHDDIIASRRGNNMEPLFKKVGEDNFNELNSLFHTFYEHFSGMKIYNVLSQLKDGKDTELTRIYQSIVEKRDIIMAKMIEHTKEYELSQTEGLK